MRDDLTDAQMAELDAVGVCGARFNLGRRYGQVHEPAAVRRTMDRLREIGWHARLHVTGADIPDWADFLLGVKDLPLVIDHMGHLDFSLGLDQPVLRWMLDRLTQDVRIGGSSSPTAIAIRRWRPAGTTPFRLPARSSRRHPSA